MAGLTVITGANRGIGRELARQALARGDAVAATARDAAGRAALPEGAEAHALDVTDPQSCADFAAALGGRPVNLLICNAGAFLGRGGLDDPAYDRAAWETTLMTNVAGPFFTVRALGANLAAAKGRVAIIGSRMGCGATVDGRSFAYRASKAAAANLAFSLAAALSGDGVAVGVYHPGWVRTDMGGGDADLSVEESAAGLLARFDALTAATSGVFEDWRGQALAL
jgi:NAD(P)-dependent dehydrogenase (short-subunit alcohol dehydrogenase family)